MNKKLMLLSFPIFILIFIILLNKVSKSLVPIPNDYVQYKNEVFYYKEKLDFAGFGCSEMETNLIPMEIWNNQGYAGYNMGTSAERIYTTYYSIKHFLKYQQPKYIFLSSEIILRDWDFLKSFYIRSWQTKPLNIVNFELVNDPVYKFNKSENLIVMFPGLNYKNQYKNFKKNKKYINKQTRGYLFRERRYNPNKQNLSYFKASDEIMPIPEINQKYYKKIVDLLNKKNIKLVVLGMPNMGSYSYAGHNALKKITSETGAEFLDYNLYGEKYGYNMFTDFNDRAHLNLFGGIKLTKMVEEYLVNEKTLVNKQKDKKYEKWNKDYYTFNNYKNSVLNKLHNK